MRLQTTNLKPANGAPLSSGPNSKTPPVLEADEDQEVITGPELEDDSLAAEPPVVKPGTYRDEQFTTTRKQKRRSMPAFATSPRAVSPEILKSLSPHARNGNAFAAQQYRAQSPQKQAQPGAMPIPQMPASVATTASVSPASSQPGSGSATPSIVSPLSQRAPNSILTPITPPSRSRSPQKSTGMHSGYPSRRSSVHAISRPPSVQPPSSIQSTPNASAINLANGNHVNGSYANGDGNGNAYPGVANTDFANTGLVSSASRTSLADGANGGGKTSRANKRASVQTMSSMSPTMAALYGQHEKEWKHRQSVTPEDLVAKGLDEGVFAGLR